MPFALFESDAIAAPFAGFEIVSFGRFVEALSDAEADDAGSLPGPDVVVSVVVVVHASVIVDVMAITPKVVTFIGPPRPDVSVR